MRMSDEDIDDVLQTNLAGSIRLARRSLKGMIKARSGRIIFVGLGRRPHGLGRPGQLRRGEGRTRRRSPITGPRGRIAGHHRQRGGPGLRRDGHDRRARRRPSRPRFLVAFPSAGMLSRPRLPARSTSWPRRPTSPAQSSPSMADSEWATSGRTDGRKASHGSARGQAHPGHRGADRQVDRLPRRAPGAGGGRDRGPDLLRPRHGPDQAHGRPTAVACRPSSSSTSRTPTTSPPSPVASASTSTASTASCTRSATRRRPPSAATS